MQTPCADAMFLVVVCLTITAHAAGVSDNFSSNPLAAGSPWSFGIGSNANNQFVWNNNAPAYAGDAPGSLTVNLNSSLPTARFDDPLGTTLTDTSSFTVSAVFSLNMQSAAGQFMQIAFGLTNSSSTGGDRTGSPANYSAATIPTTRWSSIISRTSIRSMGGPTITPSIFGATTAAMRSPISIRSSAPRAIWQITRAALPRYRQALRLLDAQVAYDGLTKTATLTVAQVNADGSLTPLDTQFPIQMNLTDFGSGYDPSNPFVVNTLSIMAYQDGFTTSADPSLVATLVVQNISLSLVTAVPEPSTLAMLLIAGSTAALAARSYSSAPRPIDA